MIRVREEKDSRAKRSEVREWPVESGQERGMKVDCRGEEKRRETEEEEVQLLVQAIAHVASFDLKRKPTLDTKIEDLTGSASLSIKTFFLPHPSTTSILTLPSLAKRSTFNQGLHPKKMSVKGGRKSQAMLSTGMRRPKR